MFDGGRYDKKFIKQKQQINNQDNELSIPEHIAIIMDGNGRWAKNRKMPRIKGHYEGMQTVKKITRKANDLGVKYLTLYAFLRKIGRDQKMK